MDKQLKDLWGDGLAEQVEQAYSAEQALPGPALLKQRIMYTPQREVQGRKRVFKPQLSRPQWVAGGVILILVGIFTNYNDPGSSRFTPQEVAVLEAVFADVSREDIDVTEENPIFDVDHIEDGVLEDILSERI